MEGLGAVLTKILIVLLIADIKANDFEYGNQGYWYDQFQTCAGIRQSPIELNSADALLSNDIADLTFHFYETPFDSILMAENNGRTVNIQLPKPKGYIREQWQTFDRISPHITGAQLPNGRFVAESIHFHWGSKDFHGSEHVIDSERYSLEMHIVHRNSKYETVDDALENSDGLAVLGIMYQVQPNTADFEGLQSVVNNLSSINEWNQSVELSDFSLSSLFGNLDPADFYTYEGSLTTPPCSEVVTWTVFTDIIPISLTQMNEFRKLSDEKSQKLENNYRALQAKGNRKVYLRKNLL